MCGVVFGDGRPLVCLRDTPVFQGQTKTTRLVAIEIPQLEVHTPEKGQQRCQTFQLGITQQRLLQRKQLQLPWQLG